MTENAITTAHNTLLVLGEPALDCHPNFSSLLDNFCGTITRTLPTDVTPNIYACGDLSLLPDDAPHVRVIQEVSTNIPEGATTLHIGQVPTLVHGLGVLYERMFEEDDLFTRIQQEHEFQNLTESTKPHNALRTGIYLTEVTQEPDNQDILHFRLMRCSSNFTGPTDNFRDADHMIMDTLNTAAREVFEASTDINHVLAQVYLNSVDDDERARERKARISAHADKTKDMDPNGLLAFCTFYDPKGFGKLRPSPENPNDWCYKNVSGLTRLLFKLKSTVEDTDLPKEFSVTLYPNSVFIIPLSTNRLYTHETRPSMLGVDTIPTRMGYVARCSKAEAQFMDGQTFLKENGELIPLAPMTQETLKSLRHTYVQENRTDDDISYGKVHFSMNAGDYQRPIH